MFSDRVVFSTERETCLVPARQTTACADRMASSQTSRRLVHSLERLGNPIADSHGVVDEHRPVDLPPVADFPICGGGPIRAAVIGIELR